MAATVSMCVVLCIDVEYSITFDRDGSPYRILYTATEPNSDEEEKSPVTTVDLVTIIRDQLGDDGLITNLRIEEYEESDQE